MTDWQNRIVDFGVKPADQFLAHPKNARMHPQFQRDVMRAALDTVGWVAPVIESTSGFLLDGHERVWQGLQHDNASVPYVQVDVTEDEEAYILATFDPITSLAQYEQDKLDALLQDVQSDSAAVQQMLAELNYGFIPANDSEWGNAFDGLPTDGKSPFQQMTFTLHDDQVRGVFEALKLAKGMGTFETENENSNGNALARICEVFITEHGQS